MAAAASVAIVSWKKDNAPETNKAAESAAPDRGQELMRKIKDFAAMREAYKSGIKSDETMTVAEAREILDLTINYEHSEHETYCVNTVLDTLHIAMPAVDGNGNVSVIDVAAAYEDFEGDIASLATMLNDNLNVFSYFSITMPEFGTKDNEITIVFTRGEAEQDSIGIHPGPFVEGDDFYWGKRLGYCNSIYAIPTDAAIELSKKFKFVPNPPDSQYFMLATEIEYGYYDFDDLTDPEMCNEYGYWMFWEECCKGDEPCIGYEEMNCYWRGINRNVVNANGILHYSSTNHIPYHEATIFWKERTGNNTPCIWKSHNLIITYANVYYIP